MAQEELKACRLMLDMGVAIPVRPLKYLHRKKKPCRIIMRTPYAGTIMRIDRLYLRLGVTYEELKEYSYEQNADFISKHGKTISRMVAYTLVRGWLAGRLLNRLVAWWLRWRVHPMMMQEAMFQMLAMLNKEDFPNTIKLAQKMNLMKPNLSH